MKNEDRRSSEGDILGVTKKKEKKEKKQKKYEGQLQKNKEKVSELTE